MLDRIAPDTHLGMFIDAKPERPKRERREREPEVQGPTETGEWNGPVPSFLNLSAL